MTLEAESVRRVARALGEARRVLFVTGAGISADSGLPTYRGIGGLYDGQATEDGVPIEVALSGAMMRRDPALCWKYIHQIEEVCRGARPNPAHHIIAALDDDRRQVTVLTQNVDGLHRDAETRDLIEIHGNVHDLRCTECPHQWRVESYAGLPIPPRCSRCGGLVRPQVVLFGEMLPAEAVARAMDALDRGFDMVFSVGTTSVFPYIAEPVVRARRQGRLTVEINPGTSEVSSLVDVRLRDGAASTLQTLWSAVSRPGA